MSLYLQKNKQDDPLGRVRRTEKVVSFVDEPSGLGTPPETPVFEADVVGRGVHSVSLSSIRSYGG